MLPGASHRSVVAGPSVGKCSRFLMSCAVGPDTREPMGGGGNSPGRNAKNEAIEARATSAVPAARPQIDEDGHPELRALGLLDREAEDVPAAIRYLGDRQIRESATI